MSSKEITSLTRSKTYAHSVRSDAQKTRARFKGVRHTTEFIMKKKPLYRKVNTKTHGVRHHFGGDFKASRNTKNYASTSMKKGTQRGLDYTPLFKFLISRVGQKWNSVHSEIVARLDKEEPIYWLVAKNKESANPYVRVGESSYYSGLFVDVKGILNKVAPEIGAETLEPQCKCCTHTFNGIVFTKKYKG